MRIITTSKQNYKIGYRQLKLYISRVRPEFLNVASPLLPSKYFDVVRKKDAGRGDIDKHNKFFSSSKLSSDKFTKAEATGRFFENLMEPIGPRS